MIIQELKIAEKKSKSTKLGMQQMTDSWQLTKHSQSASSVQLHLECIVGETIDFPDLKTNASN